MKQDEVQPLHRNTGRPQANSKIQAVVTHGIIGSLEQHGEKHGAGNRDAEKMEAAWNNARQDANGEEAGKPPYGRWLALI